MRLKIGPPAWPIFNSNTPDFFAPEERPQYSEFMQSLVLKRPYLVLRDGDEVVGCGGLKVIAQEKTAFLSWGMVARHYHGKGVGRFLAEARLNLARGIKEVETVTLNTSQHTRGFYEKLGFTTTKVTPNGYAPRLDRWDMILQVK